MEETLLLFDEQNPCWTENMIELVGKNPADLIHLLDNNFLEKDDNVYFLTLAGTELFIEIANQYFIPCCPGNVSINQKIDKKREAYRSWLQILLDMRHIQRWGLKEYVKPFRFKIPDLKENELFELNNYKLTWKYQENCIFVNMAKNFPIINLKVDLNMCSPFFQNKTQTPKYLSNWCNKNIPKMRIMEADLLYKSRYDFQDYASFQKLPCDPCGLLNADRFMCFFTPCPTPENKHAILNTLGEFHMFLTMMRYMYIPGYVDFDSLEQDMANWLLYVYEFENDAVTCAELLAIYGQSLAGPAAPLEVWSLSLEALQKHKESVESIHDLLPYTAHSIYRRK